MSELVKFVVIETDGKFDVWLFLGEGKRICLGSTNSRIDARSLIAQSADMITDAAFQLLETS